MKAVLLEMDLLSPEMVNIFLAAAGSFHPCGHRLAVRPGVMRIRLISMAGCAQQRASERQRREEAVEHGDVSVSDGSCRIRQYGASSWFQEGADMLKWIAASTVLLASGLHAVAKTAVCDFASDPASYAVFIDDELNVFVIKGIAPMQLHYGGTTGTNMPENDAGIWWSAERGDVTYRLFLGFHDVRLSLEKGDDVSRYSGKCWPRKERYSNGWHPESDD